MCAINIVQALRLRMSKSFNFLIRRKVLSCNQRNLSTLKEIVSRFSTNLYKLGRNVESYSVLQYCIQYIFVCEM